MRPFAVSFLPESEEHLFDLREYIASQAGTETADRFVRRLIEEILSLGMAPHRGERRQGLRHDLRTIGFRRRVAIIFRIDKAAHTVDIVSVLYRGRVPSEAHRYEHSTNDFS